MFLVIGGLLVISGMVLNTLISGDADAQVGVKDAIFRNVICEGLMISDGGLFIADKNGRERGTFGLTDNGDAFLRILGDDGKKQVAYLGGNIETNGMMFVLKSKSKTDKREAIMGIDDNGGRFESCNKMGEQVVRLVVHSDGGGVLDLRDKYGDVK